MSATSPRLSGIMTVVEIGAAGVREPALATESAISCANELPSETRSLIDCVNTYIAHHPPLSEVLTEGSVTHVAFRLLLIQCGIAVPEPTAARFAAEAYTLFVQEHLIKNRDKILGFDAEFVYEAACSACSSRKTPRHDKVKAVLDAIRAIDREGNARWLIKQPGQLEELFKEQKTPSKAGERGAQKWQRPQIPRKEVAVVAVAPFPSKRQQRSCGSGSGRGSMDGSGVRQEITDLSADGRFCPFPLPSVTVRPDLGCWTDLKLESELQEELGVWDLPQLIEGEPYSHLEAMGC